MKTDFNGDGLSDVLWLAPNGDLIIWFADDGGTLRTTKTRQSKRGAAGMSPRPVTSTVTAAMTFY